MDVISTELFKDPWLKIWAGNWSLHTCSYWGEMYTSNLSVFNKTFLNQVIFIVKEGKSAAYATERDRREFGTHLAAEVTKHPERVSEICSDLKFNVDKIIDFINKYEGKEIDAETYKKYWEMHLEYYIPHVNVKYVVDYLDPSLLERFLPQFQDARLYAEPVFKRTEEFIISLAQIVGKKYGLPGNLVLWTLKEEFEQYFLGGKFPERSELENRMSGCALYVSQGKRQLFTGKEASGVEEMLCKTKSDNELSGAVAYGGKARGVVRVVMNPREAKEFNDGDILVAGMTRPDYMHLMKKAVAFVTDSGGILCHAAIVARELKKPCIIGTEVATKVLKDGDVVEVDADRGIVRKIS